MQILYLIGNGFDINLGMKTRFTDFCNIYQEIETDNEALNLLKQNIKENVITWADLEKRFGEYCVNIASFEDFKKIYFDLVENLGNYLEKIENEANLNSVNKGVLFQDLCFPEQALPLGDINDIMAFTSKWTNHEWEINIMTFNYTSTFEKLLGSNYENSIIGEHHSKKAAINLRNIYHIHGLLNKGLILGVNDISQILNEDFHKNKKIIQTLIKSNYNKGRRTVVDQTCINKISIANLICIFGCSLGDTDNCWWELIGKRLLKDDCKLIIFTKGEEINARHSYNITWVEDDIKDLFLSKTNLSQEEAENISSKIYVAANTEIFNNILSQATDDSLLLTIPS